MPRRSPRVADAVATSDIAPSDLGLLSLSLFISGAAALIFEQVWFHRAALAFGNTIVATSIVLSGFMGGLAIGTAVVAWGGHRFGSLLRAYAMVEVVTALAGIALTHILSSLPVVIGPLVSTIGPDPTFLTLLRLATGFALMLIPTTAMGATLPLLIGALSPARPFGQALGRLYGWNTLGAVIGVLGAELVLVGRVGVGGSAWVAGLLNLGAAVIGLMLSRRSVGVPVDAWRGAPDRRVAITSPDATHRRSLPVSLLIAAALAGGALLALEVVWFRFLSMYLLTTTLTISVMLAVVLTAIGLGSLIASTRLAQEIRLITSVPAVAFLTGSSVALSYLSFQWLTAGTQLADWRQALWLAAALTAPTSLLSGVLFTVLGRALRTMSVDSNDWTDAGTAARLAFANTAGAMCGSPLAALFLLPSLGMERTLFALAAVYGVIGLVASGRYKPGTARLSSPVFVSAVVVLAISLGTFPFGLMSQRYFPRVANAYAEDGSEIVATREGASDTIFLMEQRWQGKPVYDRLITNGYSMTGTAVPGQRYMRYFAYWPMLLHRGPLRRALVICYGVGVTASAVLDIPALESLDIVEISPEIAAVSDLIYPPASHPLHDPRSKLHIEDGRVFLQTPGERFDLITGEPPPPRTPGAANIYSREYFQLIYDRLAEGGMTTYWLPVARPEPGTDVNTIIRAFCDVFDDCSLWNATPFDFMLTGTRHGSSGPVRSDWPTAWETPSLAGKLREVGFERPQQIGATFIGDAAFLRQLTQGTPPLTDNFPRRLQPEAARPSLSHPGYPRDAAVVAMYAQAVDPVRAQQAFAASAFVQAYWPQPLLAQSLPYFSVQRVINRVLGEGGRPLSQIEDLHALLTGTPLQTLPLWLLGSDDVKQEIAEHSREQLPAIDYARGLRALATRQYSAAAGYFANAERGGLRGETLRPLQAYARCLAGDLAGARQLARGAVVRTADERHFWTWLGSTFDVQP